METGFEGLLCCGEVTSRLHWRCDLRTCHCLLSGFSGCFPGFAVKEEEVAAGRAKLVALLLFHKVLVSLYDLLHSLMVIQGG